MYTSNHTANPYWSFRGKSKQKSSSLEVEALSFEEVTETVPMHIVGSEPVTNTVIENKDATDNGKEKDNKDKDAAVGKKIALILYTKTYN